MPVRVDPLNPIDTIVAVATPPGSGGLAVVRISGRQAMAVADRIFTPGSRAGVKPSAAPSHTVHHGHVRRDGTIIDEVLLTVLRAPRTYTCEDTVEIGCHGGTLVTREVLATALAAGARMAEPGEFTRRAFLNGRLDLAQAEAVADLIHARTDRALRAAHAQLAGHLSRRMDALRDSLLLVLAHVEAHIDFPDEDIDPETGSQLLGRVEAALADSNAIARSARQGRLLREGARVALVGAPNAGKSSLLNQLLGHDRAIVSPVAGTTRDTIEDAVDIHGFPVVFVDTAGLRASEDVVEAEGIRRSIEAANQADLVLHLVDASEAPPVRNPLPEVPTTRLLRVANKSDLPLHPGFQHSVDWLAISCRTGAGIELLKEAIATRLSAGGSGDADDIAIGTRHLDALRRAIGGLELVRDSMRAGRSLDLVAADLRVAVNAVGEIVGRTTTEDLLDRIFSTFCIGK